MIWSKSNRPSNNKFFLLYILFQFATWCKNMKSQTNHNVILHLNRLIEINYLKLTFIKTMYNFSILLFHTFSALLLQLIMWPLPSDWFIRMKNNVAATKHKIIFCDIYFFPKYTYLSWQGNIYFKNYTRKIKCFPN